jgi:hypothetical protein
MGTKTTPLPQKIKVVKAVVPSAGAATTITPVEVDGRGYSRAMWILATGAAATGATIAAKIQNSATAGGSLADITSAASAGLTAAGNASKIHVIDHPIASARPYMKLTGTVGVDTFANACICILYNGIALPIDTAYATEFVQV